MPSIGQSAIANILGAKTYTVEGGFNTQFNVNGTTVQKLATAIDAGWTSASPTTPTSMAASFAAEFSSYLAGPGLVFIYCVAQGIDDETQAWADSWNPIPAVHAYTVNAASIVSRIMACSPVQSNGALAISEAVADAFMTGFGQEVG